MGVGYTREGQWRYGVGKGVGGPQKSDSKEKWTIDDGGSLKFFFVFTGNFFVGTYGWMRLDFLHGCLITLPFY